MRIAIGANHHGFHVREMLIEWLGQLGHEVVDLGTCDQRPVDYPDVAAIVARKVGTKEVERGVLISGSGLGMCIAANKVPGVRAVLCHDDMTAEMSRRHNDANVLCLASGMLGESFIQRIVACWLKAPFDGGCYAKQVAKIAALECGGPQNEPGQ
jgi:ribose 5-phosphate isomerase B